MLATLKLDPGRTELIAKLVDTIGPSVYAAWDLTIGINSQFPHLYHENFPYP